MMTVLTSPKGPAVIYWGWSSASACEPTSNLCMASFKDLYISSSDVNSLGFGTKNTCCYSGTFLWRRCTCLRRPQNYFFWVCPETRHVFKVLLICSHCEKECDFPLWCCLLFPSVQLPMETEHSARNLRLELQPGKALTHLNSPLYTITAPWETPAGIRLRQNKGTWGVINVILFWIKLHLRRKKEIVSRNELNFIARNRNRLHWFVSSWKLLKFLLLRFVVAWLIITRPFNSATVSKRFSYCPGCCSDGDCINAR